VIIRDSTFVTKQSALRLGLPTTITISNEDDQRHDFQLDDVRGHFHEIENDGVNVYGRGIGGVMLNSKRQAVMRFNMERPGAIKQTVGG
jgi:hypothetical protein